MPEDEQPAYARFGNRLLVVCEDVVYVGIAAALVVTAGTLLVAAGEHVVTLVAQRSQDAAIEVLDALLLIFIVVELLYAVRTTIAERKLVAEPFLLVGIIAAVKEIVVLAVKAAEDAGKGSVFTDQILEVGVLGGLVLALGATAWMLRIKEREPEEGD
ncbi:phosphate-starvation-inducible PsiE family protein [Kineosporia sp. R_H_3]|uniref:phosphate-starvation-inducible PsiE family protein n=1 Tax=Kineosporia sp. R_H_3 TaxID=1961848 RepID=UPI001179AC75|nr:phosphate-starvation-inducible PsiE family protein [Kineosporia sp. R_H_3]